MLQLLSAQQRAPSDLESAYRHLDAETTLQSFDISPTVPAAVAIAGGAEAGQPARRLI